MFAVDHAATALLIKRRYPSVSMTPLLVSVQAMELAWVGLNYLGIERTTTGPTVRSVADIHLAYMPFSHSIATGVAVALCAWLIVERGLGRPVLGRAIGIGIVSHLALDLMTHAPDIALWPWSPYPQIGLGLYDRAPMWGFALEVVYGVFLLVDVPGKWIAAGGGCARQPRQPLAVLSRDPWPRTVSCEPPASRRHARLRADCHNAGPGRLADTSDDNAGLQRLALPLRA